MTFFDKLKAGWNQVLNSTNGTINIITTFLLAIAASVSFPLDPLEGLIAAVVPFIAVLREWFKDGVKLKINGNVITYLLAGLVLIAPWLADVSAALKPVLEGLLMGDWSAVVPALLPLLNSILYVIREKPWERPTDGEPVPPRPDPDEVPEPDPDVDNPPRR